MTGGPEGATAGAGVVLWVAAAPRPASSVMIAVDMGRPLTSVTTDMDIGMVARTSPKPSVLYSASEDVMNCGTDVAGWQRSRRKTARAAE